MTKKQNMKNRFPLGRLVYVIGWVCMLSVIMSCKPTVPSDYIQPDTMEDILYDYHISQAMGFRNVSAERSNIYNRNLYYHAVLRKYDVTEAEFDSSLVYYYSHADRLRDIYKRVSERMEKSAINLGASEGDIAKYSQFNADGDTANIWRGAQATVLRPTPPYNRMDFTIEADSTFRRGDSFMFNFMTEFVYQAGAKDAVICINIRYDNDSVSSHYNHVSVSGFSQLMVPGCMKKDIKSINGFVYLNNGNERSYTQKLMFIDRIQMIRFHKKVVEEPKDTVHARVDAMSEQPIHSSVDAPKTDKVVMKRKDSPLPIHNDPKKDKANSSK